MNDKNGFYTMKGYELGEEGELTPAMEDYLEMICRISRIKGAVSISELAARLHVKPSSASKMVNNLKNRGYIGFEKYGSIIITDDGLEAGMYLLYRHSVLHEFLKTINGSDNELEQVEKIEHFINGATVESLEKLTLRIRADKTAPD